LCKAWLPVVYMLTALTNPFVTCNVQNKIFQNFRVKGQGGVGRDGGDPGDLYVTFEVARHRQIARQGMDLYSEVAVSYLDAMLGSR
jgi:DnaJ-class molecular chaperone